MEENLEMLEKALMKLISTESEEKASDHEVLYKNWGKFGNQEERRKQLLEIQKSNRNNKIDKLRGILELVDEDKDNCELFEPHKKVSYRPNIYVAGFHQTNHSYSNVLMLSEWMVEKPSDFCRNWYVVPCPKGVRLLVVANRGTTKFYTKHGQFKFECQTALPGGNPYYCYRKNICVLDGFYYESTNTLYLLDLLAWNNQPMTDGEAEFRQYWLKTQLEELPETKTINKNNEVIMEILPMLIATDDCLTYVLSKYPQFKDNTPPLDGLLFYHKRGHYVAGETPLVGWLYPYMIPEVLGRGIKLNPCYMAEKPKDYINQADFIQKFEAKMAMRKRGFQANRMETESFKTVTTTETPSAMETEEANKKINDQLINDLFAT